VNDFLIVAAISAAGDLGVKHMSLNFAVFRAALERGERIGAGPVTRAWRGVLVFASRWFQIESLYKFNAKFAPVWVPRFFVWPGTRDTPRVALAALEAEAFLVWPKLEVRRLARRLGLGRVRRRLLQATRPAEPATAARPVRAAGPSSPPPAASASRPPAAPDGRPPAAPGGSAAVPGGPGATAELAPASNDGQPPNGHVAATPPSGSPAESSPAESSPADCNPAESSPVESSCAEVSPLEPSPAEVSVGKPHTSS
jgi:hypothetical protein